MKNNNGLLLLGASFTLVALSGLIFRKKIKTKLNALSNNEHLNSLNPKYKQKFISFYNAVIRAGYTPQINSSYRSIAEQAKQHQADSRNPKISHHNFGLAIDMQVSKNGKTYGKTTNDLQWHLTGIPEIAKKLGIAWGGDIKGYQDAVHWYIPLNTSILYTMALEQFKTNNPNKIIGNRLNLA